MTRPRVHANRFRIWQYCQPLGWDVTMGEVAKALGISIYAVMVTSRSMGWLSRFRVPTPSGTGSTPPAPRPRRPAI